MKSIIITMIGVNYASAHGLIVSPRGERAARTRHWIRYSAKFRLDTKRHIFMRALITATLSLACVTMTHAFDKPEYQNLDPKVRDWFKSVRSPKGVPCCDIADGHRTTWRGTSEGGYEVPIEGEWRHVPPEAIVYNAGNPVGEAIVWYVMTYPNNAGPVPYIRCFVPGGGV